jgi:restriction system protein
MPPNPLPPGASSTAQSLVATLTIVHHLTASLVEVQRNAALLDTSALLLQAVIVPGESSAEGQLIQSVALPWFKLVDLVVRSPGEVHSIGWRTWEEIIAGAYTQQGFEVTLTPRSNDKGRDVIATKRGWGSVRLIEQVKAYGPGHLVSADDVRAMLGVLTLDPAASKALVTTTSGFAPGIYKDPDLARVMPTRLELKARDALIEWLASIASARA